MELLRFPLMRIGLAFISGLMAASLLPHKIGWVALILIPAALILSKKGIWGGVFLLMAAFCTGVAVQNLHYKRPGNHYLAHCENRGQLIRATIHERLKNGRSSHRYIACVTHLDRRSASGRLLINIRGSKKHLSPQTPVAFYSVIRRHRAPANPGQFDYGKYLDDKMIPAQVYLNQNDVVTGAPTRGLRWACDYLRSRIIFKMRQSGMAGPELSVAHALILGQRQELDRDLVTDYEIAGAVHILSVSGLHVGFVMMMVNFVLRPLPHNRIGRRGRLWIQLLCLWGFALLTGLSPSVVRSAAMFSMLAAGESLRRRANRFHTLMVSAILILMVDPSLIFDVGFQLSYCAVLFIIWLYPMLRRIYEPRNTVLKYFRDVAAVSLAAQAGTLPLCLFYFHQFPGLFLITNLAIIPLVTLIMALGLTVMALAVIGWLPLCIVRIFENTIKLLNYIIATIADADGFAFKELPFTVPMAVASAILIVSLTVWLQMRRKTILVAVLASLAGLQLIYLLEKNAVSQGAELVVFHDRHSNLITSRKGCALTVYTDSLNDFHLKPYITQNFIETVTQRSPEPLIFFAGKRILVVDSAEASIDLNPDLVILKNSPRINLDRALDLWRPEMVIADGTNFKSMAERWEKSCGKRKIPFHHTGEKGSFIIKRRLLP